MNKETFPATGDNDFDRPPEQELVTLFASCAPLARPVDVETLLTLAETVRLPFFHWRNPMLRRVAALLLATSAVVAVTAWLTLFGSGSQISFAAVQEKVAQTRSVMYKLGRKASDAPVEMQRTLVLAGGIIRTEFPGGDYGVIDMNTAKGLMVSTHDKSATIQLGLYVPSGFNLYDMLRKVVNDKSTRLPDEVIDGRKVSVFRAEYSEQVRRQANACPPMKVWVDPETKLPIRIEAISQDDREPWTMYDLAFDQPLDPALFSMSPPDGYTVTIVGSARPLPAPPDKPDLLAPEIIPGVGLGRVKFGTSKENVIKIFGKPDVEEREYIGYPSRGYGFYIASQSGVVVGFTCLSQQTNNFRVRDFAGKTKEGIGIGSSLKDLENAFGKPDNMETEHLNTYLYYHNLGLQLTLIGDKVAKFNLLSPRLSAGKPKGDSAK